VELNRAARLALWLQERSLSAAERDPIVGDLLEEFESRAFQDRRLATRWLWEQTLRSVVPNVRRRLRTDRMTPGTAPARGARMLNGLATDLRFALRLLRRQPLTAAVGFISLAAGLGLNVLLLTLADAVLLRPLPLREPHRLVLLLLQRETGLMHNFSYPEYQDLRDGTRSLESLVAYGSAEATIAAADGATSVDGAVVSGNFFEALGVPMRTGRGLTTQDDRPQATPAVVISDRLWRSRFGSAALAGQTISLNRQLFTVVGVAASRFQGMDVGKDAAFWIPLAHSREIVGGDFLGRRTMSWLTVMGRLRADITMDAARQELDALLRHVRKATGREFEPVVLRPGERGDSMLSEQLASPMLLLLGAGALVLLVACLNVANLQIARTDGRRLELAVRAALGARQVQLIRLMLIDGLLFGLAAGAAGIVLALVVKDRARSLIALYGDPVSVRIPIDGRVIAAALALSLVAALVIAMLSTWQVVRRRAADALADGRAATPAHRATQRGLVVAQVALSMGLLTGAALLVRTLDRLRQTDLGFDAHHIAVVQVSPEMGRLSSGAAVSYFDDVVRTVAALPGVQSAGVSHVMPLDFGGSRMSVDVAGYRPSPDEDMELNFARVTPGYFATLGVPVRQGRSFDEHDRAGQPERIIVNETMARRFWPDGRPVGRFVRFDARSPYDVEVIGVVPDVHYRMVREEPRPSFYVPLAQVPAATGVIHVRVAGDPAARVDELRRAVATVNPLVPVIRAYPLLDQIERNIADERMAVAIGMTLAGVALLLATAGLYATMAFLVGRRTREIGVRVALGAQTSDVQSLLLREGVMLAVFGVAGGLALSLWVGRTLRAQLYGVSPADVVSLLIAAFILSGAALLASWIPARRASRVDPVVALRES
jgi:predicted permease